MPATRKIKTLVPDRKWRKLLNERGFTRSHKFENAVLEPFKKMLLDIGGWAVVLPFKDPDVQHLLRRGRRFPGRSISIPGQPSQCHFNSCCLWEMSKNRELTPHKDVKICTGYALSRDGVWRQHTWCVFEVGNRLQVIETTVKRVQYFGYVLSDEEAELFVFNNV